MRRNELIITRGIHFTGKQFRVVVLSTVRTRHTCSNGDAGLDFGFLSNAKLLTTAITRAQSLVAVVGDPMSLVSVGKCRSVTSLYYKFCSSLAPSFDLYHNAISMADIIGNCL